MNKILSFTRGTDSDILLPFTQDDIDFESLSDMYITLYQKDFKITKLFSDNDITLVTVTKEIEEETEEGDTVPVTITITRPSLHLTQAETLNFRYGRAELEIKIINKNGVVSAINPILWIDVKQSLYDKIITADAGTEGEI